MPETSREPFSILRCLAAPANASSPLAVAVSVSFPLRRRSQDLGKETNRDCGGNRLKGTRKLYQTIAPSLIYATPQKSNNFNAAQRTV